MMHPILTLFAQLDWRAPAWGLLVLIPVALAGLGVRQRHKLMAYADAVLRPWALSGGGALGDSPWRIFIWWLAWMLLAVAAAGPRLPLDAPEAVHAAPRHRMTLMVLLDISASMRATDIAPDRLSRARLELRDLLRRMRGERVGVIVFAGRAGLLLPPTWDLAQVGNALQQARFGLIEAPGSNLAAALDLARTTLSASPHAAVLLLGDGDTDSLDGKAGEMARVAAARLGRAGIPLFILGVGSEMGALIPLADGGFAERDGQPVRSRMAPEILQDLAHAAGGRFASVTDGDGDWQALYDGGIALLPGNPLPPEHVRAWRELFMWPLAAALLLFLLHVAPLRRLGHSARQPEERAG